MNRTKPPALPILRGMLIENGGKLRYVVINQAVTLELSDPDACPFMEPQFSMRAPDISKQIPDDDGRYTIAMIQYAEPKAILKQIVEEVFGDTEEDQE